MQGSHQNASTTNSSVIQTNRCDQPKCGRPVDILERVAVENHVFHKSCFVCAICNSWLNHFNYCFVPDHDKFYCIQHYQDIENASFGLGEDIRHAMGIGPGVQQQFKFTPGVFSTYFIMPPAFLTNCNQLSVWSESGNVVMFYPWLQRWVDQINLLNEEWFVLWNIMCVNMHHTHIDRNNILFLLRSCLRSKKEKERTEKGKQDAYNIDHRF